MAETTEISWCDSTFNPWIGCTKISPACDGCYAENFAAKRFRQAEWGGPGKGAGTRTRTSARTWNDPIRWNRKAERDGTRPFVFCASLADVFDNQVPVDWRADLFGLIRQTPRLVWLLLTKRPQLIVKLSEEAGGLPPNAALGTTVEDQERADRNVPHLLSAKAALNPLFAFLSCEPLLGPIDLISLPYSNKVYPGHALERVVGGPVACVRQLDALAGVVGWVGQRLKAVEAVDETVPRIDWVIAGGETDQGAHKARPMHPGWVRSLRDQCAAAGVPFHFKQWGEWHTRCQMMTTGEPVFRTFSSFNQWVDKASTWIDGGICLDSKGRLCRVGADFMRARDEGSFPVTVMHRVGKRAAGRLLDGVLHDARPEVR